jgi:hypothetical protein
MSPVGGLDPGLEPVLLPSGRLHLDQHYPSRLHEQDAQVSIAALRCLAQDGAIAGRDLLRDQAEPCGPLAIQPRQTCQHWVLHHNDETMEPDRSSDGFAMMQIDK